MCNKTNALLDQQHINIDVRLLVLLNVARHACVRAAWFPARALGIATLWQHEP